MDDLIERLAGDLRPVRRRRASRQAAALIGLLAVELALWLLSGHVRPGLPRVALTTPSFWWKLGSAAALMILAATTLLASLDPRFAPRRGLLALALAAGVYVAIAAILIAPSGLGHWEDRLNPAGGLECMSYVLALSAPAFVAMGILMRDGAPTDPLGASLAGGLAAAGFGAFVFAFTCPHDDPLFIALWYPSCALVAAVAASLILPRLSRW